MTDDTLALMRAVANGECLPQVAAEALSQGEKDAEAIHQIIFKHVYQCCAGFLPAETLNGPVWKATEKAAQEVCTYCGSSLDEVCRTTPKCDGPDTRIPAQGAIEHMQQRGRHYDIIKEAIATYDEWMLDDCYDSMSKLHEIMKKMRERLAMTDPPHSAVGSVRTRLNEIAPAVEALACHQEQCDEDGVMVRVSRQAVDEVVNAINEIALGLPSCSPAENSPTISNDAKDAARYRHLRILGCAPGETAQLKAGTVMRFTSLDAHIDADIESSPSRGEFSREESRDA